MANEIKYVVATGNAFDGLTLHGPFDCHDDALAFADAMAFSDDWRIVELEAP